MFSRTTDHTDLRDQLQKISPLTDNGWEAMAALFTPVSLRKNEFLVREGDRAHFCFLLTGGIIRVFYNKDATEYNKTFFLPGSFPTPLTALLTNAPCQLNFQALTDASLLQFSYSGFRSLFREHRCLESLMLTVLGREWIEKERHDIAMVVNDAATNYAQFKKAFPDLEQQIPQYHIASYLGITPIQLSRIRSRAQQQKKAQS